MTKPFPSPCEEAALRRPAGHSPAAGRTAVRPLLLLLLALLLPWAARAANPVLTLQALGSATNPANDVTLFVDQVEILQAATGAVVAGTPANPGFESFGGLSNGNYGYNPTGASWTFNAASGIAQNGSNFGAPNAPGGTAVAFVQSTGGLGNGLLQQTLALGAGTYQVRFRLSQRGCCSTNDQRLRVLVDGVVVGTATSTNLTGYDTFTSASFTVDMPAVTALAPSRNARTAAVAGNVAVTFSEAIDNATANNLKVFSAQAGGRKAGAYSTSGGTITFDPTTNFKPGETVWATVPATVRNPGGVANTTKQVYQFTTAVGGTGVGTFGGGSTVSVGSSPRGVTLGDADGDGDLDLFVANQGGGTVSVRLNNGSGNYPGTQTVSMGAGNSNLHKVVLGDVDGDGDLDLLANNTAYNTVSVRLNDGTGAYSGTQAVAVGAFPTHMALGDVDADGDLDLLTANYGVTTVSVRLNDGAGTYSGTQNVAVGVSAEEVTTGDVDGDGDLDLLAAGFGSNVSVRVNNGSGAFSGTQEVAVGGGGSGVALGDVDGDGDLDLAAANYDQSTVSVRLNKLADPAITAVAPNPGGLGQALTLTGTNLVSPSALTINGANALSNIISNTGTSLVVRVPATAAATGTVSFTNTDGTATAAFTVVPPPGNALAFDGVNDHVALPAATPVPVGNAAYTIEAWIKPTSMGVFGIIGWGNFGTNNQVTALRLDASGIHHYWWNNDLTAPTGNLAGAWHHVAATFDGITRKIYLDGVLKAQDTPTGHAVPNANNLRIGSTCPSPCGGEYFPGSLDEVRVYSVALTPAQVQADMTSTAAAVPASLVLYYNMDQGTPATASTGDNAGLTTLYDLANGTAGTLTNFALTSGNTTSNYVESYALVVPALAVATGRTATGFTANWTAPALGTVDNGYRLEVATSTTFAPASLVAGSPLTVAGTSQAVGGLDPTQTYYYRVRADKTSVTGQGAYSPVGRLAPFTPLTPPGNALAFDGAGDEVRTTTQAPAFGTGDFTLEAWVRTGTTNSDAVLAIGSTGGNNYWLGLRNGFATVSVSGTECVSTTARLNDNRWHHLAGVRSNGVLTVYADGVAVGSRNNSLNANPSAVLGIGSFGNGSFFWPGSLDEVRVYNAALTPAQIQADMTNTNPAVPASLLAYYNFDHGTAATATTGSNTGFTTLADQSANGTDGTLLNFALTSGNTVSNWVESYALLQPTGLAVSARTSSGFTASWTAPLLNGAAPAAGLVEGYVLDVSTSATFASGVSSFPVSGYGTTSAAATGLANGTDYYLRVRAEKASVTGQGDPSAVVSTHTVGTDALLTNLVASTGVLSPAFATATQAYTLYVSPGTSAYTLTPTASSAYTTITVDGVPVANGAASAALSVGSTASVVLTSEDGNATATYTVQALVAPGYFRSAATGNWGSPATWESSFDNASWAAAPVAPLYQFRPTATVRNGHTVTAATAESLHAATIESGGVLNTVAGQILTVPSGSAVTVAAGGVLSIGQLTGVTSGTSVNVGRLSLAGTLTVNGTLVLNTGTTSLAGQGISTTTTTVGNGGRVVHFATSFGIAMPAPTWNPGSTLELAGGVLNQTYVAVNQTLQNLEVNLTTLPAGNATTAQPFLFVTTATATVAGTLTVRSTGAGTLRLFGTPTSGTLTLGSVDGSGTRSGGYVQLAGTRVVGSYGGANTTTGTAINVVGNFQLTGGTFAAAQGSSTTASTLRTIPLAVAGDLTVASGATFNLLSDVNPTIVYAGGTVVLNGNFSNAGTVSTGNTASAIQKLHFGRAGTQTFSNTGSITGRVNAQVNAGTTLDMGTSLFTGAGAFSTATFGNTVATLRLGDPDGVTTSGAVGNVQNTGVRSFAGGTGYVFSGTTPQTLGAAFPVATLNNTNARLVFDNPAGVTLAAPVSTLAGTLQLQQGVVTSTAANLLTLGISTSFPGILDGSAGNTGRVVGPLKRWVAAATGVTATFPVGTAARSLPATVTYSAAPTTSGSLTAEFVATPGGRNGLPFTDASSGVRVDNVTPEGFWRLTRADGLSNDGTYTPTFTFTGLGGVNDPSTLVLLKRTDESQPWESPGTHVTTGGTAAAPVLSRTGLTGFSDFTAGGNAQQNPLPVELISFAAERQGTAALLRWATAQEQNNDFFAVERSLDGSTFQEIDRVRGQGTTSSRHDYRYVDPSFAAVSNRVVYYRLRQVDLNGTSRLLPVRALTADAAVSGPALELYPTLVPAGQALTYTRQGQLTEGAELLIFTVSGQRVATHHLPAGASGVLPVGPLPAGWYLVRMQLPDGQTVSARFAVQ